MNKLFTLILLLATTTNSFGSQEARERRKWENYDWSQKSLDRKYNDQQCNDKEHSIWYHRLEYAEQRQSSEKSRLAETESFLRSEIDSITANRPRIPKYQSKLLAIRLYRAILQRSPESQNAINNNAQKIQSGGLPAVLQVAREFLNSPEFWEKFRGAASKPQLTNLYLELFGEYPSTDNLKKMVNHIFTYQAKRGESLAKIFAPKDTGEDQKFREKFSFIREKFDEVYSF